MIDPGMLFTLLCLTGCGLVWWAVKLDDKSEGEIANMAMSIGLALLTTGMCVGLAVVLN